MPANIAQYETLRKSELACHSMAQTFGARKIAPMERNGLKIARKRANLTQEAIAEIMGVSVPQISRWESGKDGIPSQRMASLAKAYQAPIGELLGEEDGGDVPAVMVELLPTHVGAGGGGVGEGDYKAVAFSRALIEDDLKVDPDSLLAVIVEGDSMKPEFLPGDQLLIDKRKVSIAQPGAFCLWDGDGYVIKYLEKVYGADPPRIRVMSENERYQTTERLVDEVRVMGRVIWIGRRI